MRLYITLISEENDHENDSERNNDELSVLYPYTSFI